MAETDRQSETETDRRQQRDRQINDWALGDREIDRQKDRERQIDNWVFKRERERERERETWCFTPNQPLWLYQGGERDRQTDRQRLRQSGRQGVSTCFMYRTTGPIPMFPLHYPSLPRVLLHTYMSV